MKNLLLLLLFLLPLPTLAADTAKESYEGMIRAADNNETTAVRGYILPSGLELYDRFTGYNLLPCLPKDSQYVSETSAGPWRVVRAGMTDISGKWRVAKLYFAKDGGRWKWDVNETLHHGLGEKWQKQINVMEQLYLLMRAQMGGHVTCAMVKQLAKTQ